MNWTFYREGCRPPFEKDRIARKLQVGNEPEENIYALEGTLSLMLLSQGDHTIEYHIAMQRLHFRLYQAHFNALKKAITEDDFYCGAFHTRQGLDHFFEFFRY